MEPEPSALTQRQQEPSALRALSQDFTVRCSLFRTLPVDSFFKDDSQTARTSSTPIQMSAEPEPETRGQVMPDFGWAHPNPSFETRSGSSERPDQPSIPPVQFGNEQVN